MLWARPKLSNSKNGGPALVKSKEASRGVEKVRRGRRAGQQTAKIESTDSIWSDSPVTSQIRALLSQLPAAWLNGFRFSNVGGAPGVSNVRMQGWVKSACA